MLITADHGMIQTDPSKRIDIAANPRLASDVRLIGGEPRAPMIYLSSDVDPADAAVRWQEELGDDAHVMTRDEAIRSGLYGPVRPDVRPMIGDLVIAATGRATIVDSRRQNEKATHLPGAHGSLTPMETHIPLLLDVV